MAALLIAVIALGVDGTPRAWLDCLFGWWLLALGWISLRVLLPPYLESRLVSALHAAGFPHASLRVVRADLSGAELVDVSLWPDARAGSVRIEYSIGDPPQERL